MRYKGSVDAKYSLNPRHHSLRKPIQMSAHGAHPVVTACYSALRYNSRTKAWSTYGRDSFNEDGLVSDETSLFDPLTSSTSLSISNPYWRPSIYFNNSYLFLYISFSHFLDVVIQNGQHNWLCQPPNASHVRGWFLSYSSKYGETIIRDSMAGRNLIAMQIGTPTASVSNEVAAVQRLMKASGLSYSMHSAGTTVGKSSASPISFWTHSNLHLRIRSPCPFSKRGNKFGGQFERNCTWPVSFAPSPCTCKSDFLTLLASKTKCWLY